MVVGPSGSHLLIDWEDLSDVRSVQLQMLHTTRLMMLASAVILPPALLTNLQHMYGWVVYGIVLAIAYVPFGMVGYMIWLLSSIGIADARRTLVEQKLRIEKTWAELEAVRVSLEDDRRRQIGQLLELREDLDDDDEA